MATKCIKRPRDPIQLGKLIVDIATGQVVDKIDDERDSAAVARGQLGGRKGGLARAEAMPAPERKAIARKAARARWAKAKEPAT
jgi:hypothetical protein